MSQDVLDGTRVDTSTLIGVVAGKGTDGLAHPMQLDANGKLNVNISAIVSGAIDAGSGDNIEIKGRDAGSVLRTIKTLSDGAVVVSETEPPSVLQYGQKTVAVTGTAVQLTAGACNAVIVQGLAGNAGNVVIGDSAVTTANGFQLQPGQATGIAINNVNAIYVNGTVGDGVCWIGS